VAAAVVVSVSVSFPPFLLGSLAFSIREDIAFSNTQLGSAVSLYYVAGALFSIVGGYLGERLGPTRSMATALFGSVAAMLAIGLLARTWTDIVGCLMLAGASNALGKSSTNSALAEAVPDDRQGLAFGLKQASAPAATLLGGLAVPFVGLVAGGWHSAFTVASISLLAFVLILPDRRIIGRGANRVAGPSPARKRRAGRDGRWLLVMAMATGFGSGAITVLGIFFVESAVKAGLDRWSAGVWLSIGGLLGLAARVGSGWLADKNSGATLRWTGRLMLMGAVGSALLAESDHLIALVLGTVLAFGAGLGWSGLFNLAVVSRNRQAPAAATGFTGMGMYLGCIAAPSGFGLVVSLAGYPLAWLCVAAMFGLGAVCIWSVDRLSG
jgi:nitrate/nitrite transporter NarK